MIDAIICALLSTTLYIPGVMYGYENGLGFFGTVVSSVAGGSIGFWIYGYLGTAIVKGWRKLIGKKSPPKKFTRFNRFMVKVRGGYGLAGIAILTPIIKNPIGFAIGMTITKNKMKLFLFMFSSLLFWALVFCGFYHFTGLRLTDLL